MKHNYANILWVQLTQGTHLGKNFILFFGVLFLMLFSSWGVVGQSTVTPSYEWLKAVPFGTVTQAENSGLTIAIDTDSNGNVYRLTFGDGVLKYDSEGIFIKKIIQSNQLNDPLDIALDSNDNIYVIDYEDQAPFTDNGKVKIFNPLGVQTDRILTSYFRPLGLTLDNDDNIYVVIYNDGSGAETTISSELRVYNNSRTLIKTFEGTSSHPLEQPYRIGVDSQKNIYISHTANNGEVIVFNNSYNYLTTLAGMGSPGSVVVDDYDFIHVIDYSNKLDFEKLLNFESLGTFEAFQLYSKIRAGVENREFGIRIYDRNQNLQSPYFKDHLELPIDLAFYSCGDRMFVDNTDLSGSLFSPKLEFELEIYRRTPSFDTEKPIIVSCPEDQMESLTAGSFILPDYRNLAAFTDNCDTDLALVQNPAMEDLITETTTITITATDDAGNFASCTFQVVIEDEVNTAPVANPDTYSTPFETELIRSASEGVLSNDTDPEDDALTAVLDVDVLNGTLSLNPNGSFSYTPNAGFDGEDFFTYHANDGEFDSAIVRVTITVGEKVNEAPVSTPDSYSTPFQTVLIRSASDGVLSNDTDPEDDVITAVLDVDVLNGTLVLNPNGSFSYTPNAGFDGEDFFTYHANDGEFDSAIVRVTITVGEKVNEAPVAYPEFYFTPFETKLLRSASEGLLSNDTDPDGDVITAILDTDVSFGTLILDPDGSFSYTPDANFSGDDFFIYNANDGEFDSQIVRVTITVGEKVNEAPVANPDTYSNPFETALIRSASDGVLSNDTDPEDDALTAVLDIDVLNGTLSLNPNGSFSYTPNAGFEGEDFFTYHANDGQFDSAIVRVTIIVGEKVNEAPVANPDTYSTPFETALIRSASDGVLSNDTDPEDDVITAVLDVDVLNGTLVLNPNGSFTYTPNTGFTGVDNFKYVANDGSENSNVATVTITVTAITDNTVICKESVTLELDESGTASLNAEVLFLARPIDIQFSINKEVFSCEDLGENTVTLSYSNNEIQDTCEVKVIVKDVSSPILRVKDISVALNEFRSVTITPEMLDDGSSDNCENLSFSLSQLTFGCKELGENTVIFTATDASGNFTSTTATVTVTGDCNINPGPEVEFIFIYPNPTSGSFQFATPAGVTIQRVEVFDFRGRMILFKDFSETDLQYRMDLTGVQNAVYVLKLFTSEGMKIKRVIID
ncbi:Ig-like domain-containing protein [Gillisia sp. JM1]|uniref:Ig-like domain-containing protein n=1 Tax=Gillisia sp. JM1 TaxID=1283286 RepID=UPI000684DF59|nr:Ig-like domain-containing protein [Gillisia sp. JM1]